MYVKFTLSLLNTDCYKFRILDLMDPELTSLQFYGSQNLKETQCLAVCGVSNIILESATQNFDHLS